MKYVGSKSRMSRELKDIIESLLEESGSNLYIEPFVGGCNVADKIDPSKARVVCGDENKYLIALFKAVVNGWIPHEDISKEEYNDIRDNKDNYPPELVAVAGICASFNACWMASYYGNSNTDKEGKVRNYYRESVNNLLKQAAKIKHIEFKEGSYTQFSEAEGAVIYCDPPYANTRGYMDDAFDSKAFWEWVKVMSEKNIVIVSEYYAPGDFKVIHKAELQVQFNDVSNKVEDKVFTINSTPYIDNLVAKYTEDGYLDDECDDMI